MSKAGQSILRGARQALDYARGERDGFVAHVPERQARIDRDPRARPQMRDRPPPAVAQSRGMGVQVRIHPDDQIGVPSKAHYRLLRRCDP